MYLFTRSDPVADKCVFTHSDSEPLRFRTTSLNYTRSFPPSSAPPLRDTTLPELSYCAPLCFSWQREQKYVLPSRSCTTDIQHASTQLPTSRRLDKTDNQTISVTPHVATLTLGRRHGSSYTRGSKLCQKLSISWIDTSFSDTHAPTQSSYTYSHCSVNFSGILIFTRTDSVMAKCFFTHSVLVVVQLNFTHSDTAIAP